jgi:S1-C subfamily serine protease
MQIETASPAAEAGMEVRDIIRRIDGAPVTDVPEAQRKIFGVQVGDTLRFEVERSGELFEIPVRAEAATTEAER